MKPNTRIVVTSAPPTSIDETNRTFEAVITTSHLDRYGSIIKTEGIDTTGYLKNPIILVDHAIESVEKAVGFMESFRVYKNRIVGKIKFLSEGVSSRADMVWGMIVEGVLRSVSVSILLKEVQPVDPSEPFGDYIIESSELIEVSVVTAPGNANTGIRSLQTGDKVIESSKTSEVEMISEAKADELLEAFDKIDTRLGEIEGSIQRLAESDESDNDSDNDKETADTDGGTGDGGDDNTQKSDDSNDSDDEGEPDDPEMDQVVKEAAYKLAYKRAYAKSLKGED